MKTHFLGVCALVLFPGCANESPPTKTTSRDSAGVQIVESSAPEWGEGSGWVVEEAPVLDLATTGEGPSHEFFRVRDAMRLDDGRVVVANYGSNEIRFFSSTGEFISSVGRQGEGPGEFQRIETLSRFGADSVAVYDYWLSRVTVLGPEGGMGRVTSLRGLADRVRQLRAFGDSGFVGLGYSFANRSTEAGKYRTTYAVIRISASGSLVDTLAMLPGLESYRYAGGEILPPFARDGKIGIRGPTMVIGSSDQMEFDRYEAGHGLTTRVRVPGFDLQLKPEETDLARRAFSPEGMPPQVLDAIGTVEVPKLRPAYSNLLVDSEGCVWAAGYQARGGPEEPMEWNVFSTNGRWLGTIRTPIRFTVFEIGSDYLLGVHQDEMDVEHVQVLSLHRDGGSDRP